MFGVALLSVLSTGMNIAQVSEFIQQMLTGTVLVVAVLIDRLRRNNGPRSHDVVPCRTIATLGIRSRGNSPDS